jgi:hypothetical protein
MRTGKTVTDSGVTTKICGPKREEVTAENCIMRSFMVCTPYQTLFW